LSNQDTFPASKLGHSLAEDRLDSWKEIASYLKREVRTVQRWEKTIGLPVHRLQVDRQGTVYAYKSELDAWFRERQTQLEVEAKHEENAGASTRLQMRLSMVGGLLAVAMLVSVGAYFAGNSRWLHRRPIAQKIKLVVLPFQNLSGDSAQEYFSDGMTEEMITQLGRLQPERLGVIARTSAMMYKNAHKSTPQICRELGVDYVLEGSVRRADDRARITAQLIQCSDQTHLWADSSERDMVNILSLQADVAQAIAKNIQLELTPQQQARLAATRTVDTAAYEAYMKGRTRWFKKTPEEDLEESIEHFSQAIQKDPTYGPAYAGLADAYALLAGIPWDAQAPEEAMPKARSAAQKALELDGSLADANDALGFVRYSYDRDWQGAEEQYKRAILANPNLFLAHLRYSWLLMTMERRAEAQEQVRKAEDVARQIDPAGVVVAQAALAEAFYFSRNYDQAIQESHKAIDLNPYFFLPHFYLAQAYLQKGMSAEAINELEKARSSFGDILLLDMALGHAYGLAGRRVEALNMLEHLQELAKHRYVSGLYMAGIPLGLGDTDRALDFLEKAYRDHADGLAFLKVEPMVDSLRSDPRFQDLLRRLRLPA
jgi:TolB-like protein